MGLICGLELFLPILSPSGTIDTNQFSSFIANEKPNSDIKVALGFCRTKDLKKLKSSNTFHFHAIESNNKVKDFPAGFLDAKKLLIYSGGRSKPINLTGLHSEIKSIELKHKSKIKTKEKSETEYYYKVILQDVFKESENLKSQININKLFNKKDDNNYKLFKKYLPAMTTWDKVISSIDKSTVNT